MQLIEQERLLERFEELIGESTAVDIAVAWIGPGRAADSLLAHADRTQIRIAVGLSGNSTDPATLRRLMAPENVQLRVATAPRGGLFHPKFYRFQTSTSSVCWIGSANFTGKGFGGNTELMHEFHDRNDEGRKWFERLWNDLAEDPESAIEHYQERYTPPRRGSYRGSTLPHDTKLPSITEVKTWGEFVSGLHALDDYCHTRGFEWDVLGETYSYLHTIGVGRDVVLRRNWDDFSVHDRNILLGLDHQDNWGMWGLLGNLQGAGAAVQAFTSPEDPSRRNHVRRQLSSVIEADDRKIVKAAELAVARIRELPRFGPAVATRPLALARPDQLVSVNSKSKHGLGWFVGRSRPSEDYLARKYGELLRSIRDTEWYRAREPEDATEREIWHCRVALVDAFIYIPNHE